MKLKLWTFYDEPGIAHARKAKAVKQYDEYILKRQRRQKDVRDQRRASA